MRNDLTSMQISIRQATLWLAIAISSFWLAEQATAAALTEIAVHPQPKGYVEIKLSFSNPVLMPQSFATQAPPRLILDFLGVENQVHPTQVDTIGGVSGYAFSQVGKRLRLVVDLKQPFEYQTRISGNDLYIILKEPLAQVDKPHDGSNKTTRPRVQHIDFRRAPGERGLILVELSNLKTEFTVDKQGQDIVVNLVNAKLPKQLQRRLNVTSFRTPVDYILAKTGDGYTQLVITVHGSVEQRIYQINHQLIIDISKQSSMSGLAVSQQPAYTGKPVSLNFQNISVRALLQVLADFTGINMVASDSVQGNITLRLHDVPWDEALAIILRAQGLDKYQSGNVFMIAPIQEIAEREKQRLAASKEVEQLEPLVNQLVVLNYANAEEIAKLMKDAATSLLSSRGSVNADKRTNTLIIQDTMPKLASVLPLIKQLDVAVQQVLIEARIVTVDTDFTEDLGIRFGATHPAQTSGAIQGANLINNTRANQNPDILTNPLLAIPVARRLNLDLPANSHVAPATIGVALAKLGHHYMLDLELSALESQGAGKLIASPRLVTANQKEAYIEQGEEIPYQEATSSGATSVEFKKAVLGLRVTPQITPDGKIMMDIKLNQDRRSAQPEILGVPAIDTEQIETQVLVDDGQTIVLGGIYSENKQHQLERIPFLGDLPIIGYLFRRTSEREKRRELLIFITPKIVQQTLIS